MDANLAVLRFAPAQRRRTPRVRNGETGQLRHLGDNHFVKRRRTTRHADQIPPVLTVESSKARFGLVRLSRREDAPPHLKQSRQIIRMNHRDPSPALAVLLRQAGVVHPLLVDELNGPVWRGAPDVRRDGIDHAKIVEFRRCHGAVSQGDATTRHRPGQAAASAQPSDKSWPFGERPRSSDSRFWNISLRQGWLAICSVFGLLRRYGRGATQKRELGTERNGSGDRCTGCWRQP